MKGLNIWEEVDLKGRELRCDSKLPAACPEVTFHAP